MPIIDPGITTFDEIGRPTLSPNAIRLPPDISKITGAVAPNSAPVFNSGPQGINSLEKPPIIQPQQQLSSPLPPLPQNNLPAPGPNLPKFSIPSDRYADIESHQPDRQALQPHGIAKVGNVLSSLAAGPFAPLLYRALQDIPYQKAERDWQGKLSAIKPEVQFEESQTRERGESERSAASLASSDASRRATEAHQKAIEEETNRQREETERKDAAAEKIKQQELVRQQRRDELTEAIRKANEARLEKQNTERDAEIARHNKVVEGIERNRNKGENEGSWQLMEDEEGKLTKQYNPKTGEVRDAPNSTAQVHKPGTFAKTEAKEKPIKDAQNYADNYVKSGKFTGAGDYALIQAFNSAVQSDRNRFQKYEFDKIVSARGLVEGMIQRGEHLADGTYLSSEQRKQFADTIKLMSQSKGIPTVNAPGKPTPGKILKREDIP